MITSGGTYMSSLFQIYFINETSNEYLYFFQPASGNATPLTQFTDSVCLNRFNVDCDYSTLKITATAGSLTQTETITQNLTTLSDKFISIYTTSSSYTSSYKLWRYKMYDNGAIVRDYIPCYRVSDNKTGLYDIVNDTFYPNEGTGEFTVGWVW